MAQQGSLIQVRVDESVKKKRMHYSLISGGIVSKCRVSCCEYRNCVVNDNGVKIFSALFDMQK